MNLWLTALIALLAFALGLTLRDLALVLTGGRYGGTIDLSAKAARGELDLDWSDARSRLLSPDEVAHLREQLTAPIR